MIRHLYGFGYPIIILPTNLQLLSSHNQQSMRLQEAYETLEISRDSDYEEVS